MSSFQARNFQITINKSSIKYYEEIKEYLLEKKPNYFISCIEENKEEELHIHIYVQFPKRMNISTKYTHGAHIEVCKGTPIENKQYIEKIKETFRINNTLDEIGTIRNSGIKSDSVLSLTEKTFDEVSRSEFKIWKEVINAVPLTMREIYKPNLEVYYIWGESGTGKSKKVFDLLQKDEPYDIVRFSKGFWIGINQFNPVKTCLYNDFRDFDMSILEFVNFIDYYKQQMNIKYCQSWLNQYERIFITSLKSPDEIYKKVVKNERERLLRRIKKMKIIHMEKI